MYLIIFIIIIILLLHNDLNIITTEKAKKLIKQKSFQNYIGC